MKSRTITILMIFIIVFMFAYAYNVESKRNLSHTSEAFSSQPEVVSIR